ncbi:MAG: Gmad2 immunoglobulin-like domain-containing protein [Propionibacteriaceae bacterium]|nr:Gmad2 immunoglobulin-like domain-containing protein [Propionibacteriaceae bacterium]
MRSLIRSVAAAATFGLVLTGCAVAPYAPAPGQPVAPGQPGAPGQPSESGQPTPSSSASTTPSTSASPGSSEPVQDAYVYFPRASSRGVRLGREVRPVEQDDPLVGALEAMIAGPLDPDYTTRWDADTTVNEVTTSGGVTTVDLSADARDGGGMSVQQAAAQADQLVWTVTEFVGAETKVMLTIDGTPAGRLWGAVTWDEPRARDIDPLGARVLVSVDTPTEGARVSSPVVITGDAAAHEANVPWRVLDAAGAVVADGFTATDAPIEFAPYRIEVTLPPGEYTIEVREDDISDGEGFRPDIDTRRFVVEG